MKYVLKKADIDLLIRQLRKYERTRNGDSYTVAIHMAENVVINYPNKVLMNSRLLEIIHSALYFNATNETIYEILKLLNIEVAEE